MESFDARMVLQRGPSWRQGTVLSLLCAGQSLGRSALKGEVALQLKQLGQGPASAGLLPQNTRYLGKVFALEVEQDAHSETLSVLFSQQSGNSINAPREPELCQDRTFYFKEIFVTREKQ